MATAGSGADVEIAVHIEGVTKRFGRHAALEEVDATIATGRLTGLVGPDGAGKTTLLRMMAALMAPTEGRIRVAGLDVVNDAERIHHVTGYMPQRFGLYEDLSVMDNLLLYARLRELEGSRRNEVFEQLLRFTRLEPFTSRLAGRLSGGMKQKLGLACALMARPQVLLLDEPSVGVDPVSRQDLWRMVEELAGQGMAVVWATAYLDEAERCEDVLLLSDGRVKFQGAPGELTGRIAGRSHAVRGVSAASRREALAEALEQPGVRDGVIQGSSLRVVLEESADSGLLQPLADRHSATVEPVPPRFEDAFIDLLGGGPGGHSAIAEKMQPVEQAAREAAVSCRELTRRFGDFTATDAVSFDVRPGEVFGLLGPNGAGKSTTFRMLCGLLRPTSGRAEVLGMDLAHAASAAKARLGYMAQKFSLYGLLSVQQNLEFFSSIYGLRGATRRRRMEEMIETFELGESLDRSPDQLPLGYKQRLALACSLMHRPSILFLDEPTSGVDPVTRREFWTHINGLVRKGVTILVTTHFMDEAEYCDRVALMYRAKLVALATPDEIKAGAVSEQTPEPTMEDAFIATIESIDRADREQVA